MSKYMTKLITYPALHASFRICAGLLLSTAGLAWEAQAQHQDDTHQFTDKQMQEHMALLRLVDPQHETHRSIRSGEWSDPSIWSNGQVPGEGARAVVAEGTDVLFNTTMTNTLMTLRVDGTLRFATVFDTELRVDTLITSAGSTFEMGSAESPIRKGVTAKVTIDDYNGGFETSDTSSPDYDPFKLGQGVIGHGRFVIHGEEKTSYATMNGALAGDTELMLDQVPANWNIGDQLVISGTKKDATGDEVRTIAAMDVDRNRITLNEALAEDHTTPPHSKQGLVLKVHVANTTRNAIIETAAEHREATGTTTTGSGRGYTGDQFEGRGHVMLMHNKNVDIRYGGFYHLGRTNKLIPVHDTATDEHGNITEIAKNSRARYSLHFHRAGITGTPGRVHGSALAHDPGWGYVNHGSYVEITQNVAYNVNGAGFVTERSDERGSFIGNLSIRNHGHSRRDTEGGLEDWGFRGHGFWFQGPFLTIRDNVAAGSLAAGYDSWFTRGNNAVDGVFKVWRGYAAEPENQDLQGNATGEHNGSTQNGPGMIAAIDMPFNETSGNTAYGSGQGLAIAGFHPGRSYGGRGYFNDFNDFTAWNVNVGYSHGYASNMRFRNLVLISDPTDPGRMGMNGGTQIEDFHIEGFLVGINAEQRLILGDSGLHIDTGHLNNLINLQYNRGRGVDHNGPLMNYRIRKVEFGKLDRDALHSLLEAYAANPIMDNVWKQNPETDEYERSFDEVTRQVNFVTRIRLEPNTAMIHGLMLPFRMHIEMDGQMYELWMKREQSADFVLFPAEVFEHRDNHRTSESFPNELKNKTNQEMFDLARSTWDADANRWIKEDGSILTTHGAPAFDFEDGLDGQEYIRRALNGGSPTAPGHVRGLGSPNMYRDSFPEWAWVGGGRLLDSNWENDSQYVDGETLGMQNVVLKKIADVTWDTAEPEGMDDQLLYTPHPATVDGRGIRAIYSKLKANDTDPDDAHSSLKLAYYGQPDYGSTRKLLNSNFDYYPAEGFSGWDALSYTFTDSHGYEGSAWANIYVPGANAPFGYENLAWQGEAGAVDEQIELLGGNRIAIDVLAMTQQHKPDFNVVTVEISGASSKGTTEIGDDGRVVYQRTVRGDTRFAAYDHITLTLRNADGEEIQAWFITDLDRSDSNADSRKLASWDLMSLDVAFLNSRPVGADDAYSLRRSESLTLDVLANDGNADGGALAVSSIDTRTTVGQVELVGGRVVYTADADFTGRDRFEYFAIDRHGDRSERTVVWIEIDRDSFNTPPPPSNTPPHAENDEAATDENTTISIDVLANDSDPDGDILSIVSATDGAHGTTRVNADGTITYTPNEDFFGTDSFSYTISDGNGGENTATVRVEIDEDIVLPPDTSNNRAPSARRNSARTMQDEPKIIPVLNNDRDPDGDPLSVISATDGRNGSTCINPDGTITYTPNSGFHGRDSFTYTISDGNGGEDTARVRVSVRKQTKVNPVKEIPAPDPEDLHALAIITSENGNLIHGSVEGTLEDGTANDDTYEAFTEELQKGISRMEHQWTFNVPSSTGPTVFYLEAHHTANSENDNFTFAYSTSGKKWNKMLTVTKTEDNNTAQYFVLPKKISGTLHVRAIDTNRKKKRAQLDTLYVDAMFIVTNHP
jgi:hypothetical protein